MTTDSDCLFCRMAKGEFPVDKIHEDGLVYAINDINPRAPTHFLVIPRQHIADARHLGVEHMALLSHMFDVANRLATELDVADRGFRMTFNVGDEGGQTIYHIHMHVLGGRRLGPEG